MSGKNLGSAKRYGFIGIIIEKGAGSTAEIQKTLSDHGDLILGRMGLPHLENDEISIITLIVSATTDEVGSLTGRLGSLPGVSVKSGLTR